MYRSDIVVRVILYPLRAKGTFWLSNLWQEARPCSKSFFQWWVFFLLNSLRGARLCCWKKSANHRLYTCRASLTNHNDIDPLAPIIRVMSAFCHRTDVYNLAFSSHSCYRRRQGCCLVYGGESECTPWWQTSDEAELADSDLMLSHVRGPVVIFTCWLHFNETSRAVKETAMRNRGQSLWAPRPSLHQPSEPQS